MKEVYVLRIQYLLHKKYSAEELELEVMLFSSQEKAEEYLLNNGFVFGESPYFTESGWFYFKCMKRSLLDISNRLVCADIHKKQIDNIEYIGNKIDNFIKGRG